MPSILRFSDAMFAPLVRSSNHVARLHLLVHQREKALGQLVGFALSHLVRLYSDQRVVAAFRDHLNRNPAHGPAVGSGPGGGASRTQPSPENAISLLQDRVGRQGRPMEIAHPSGSTRWS